MCIKLEKFIHKYRLETVCLTPGSCTVEFFEVVGLVSGEFGIEILLVETEISEFVSGHTFSLSVELSVEAFDVTMLDAASVTEVVDIHFFVIIITVFVDNSTLFRVTVHSDVGIAVGIPVVA